MLFEISIKTHLRLFYSRERARCEGRWKWLKHTYRQILCDIPAEKSATVSFFLARTVTGDAAPMNDHAR